MNLFSEQIIQLLPKDSWVRVEIIHADSEYTFRGKPKEMALKEETEFLIKTSPLIHSIAYHALFKNLIILWLWEVLSLRILKWSYIMPVFA